MYYQTIDVATNNFVSKLSVFVKSSEKLPETRKTYLQENACGPGAAFAHGKVQRTYQPAPELPQRSSDVKIFRLLQQFRQRHEEVLESRTFGTYEEEFREV